MCLSLLSLLSPYLFLSLSLYILLGTCCCVLEAETPWVHEVQLNRTTEARSLQTVDQTDLNLGTEEGTSAVL